jgi:hypothetical protein
MKLFSHSVIVELSGLTGWLGMVQSCPCGLRDHRELSRKDRTALLCYVAVLQLGANIRADIDEVQPATQ